MNKSILNKKLLGSLLLAMALSACKSTPMVDKPAAVEDKSPQTATAPVAPAAPVTPQTAPAGKPGATNSVTSKTAPTAISGSRVETRVGMSKMRQTIARRLKES